MSLRWAVLSTFPEKSRFEALSAAIRAAGLENELSLIETDQNGFEEKFRQAQAEFSQLRIGPELALEAYGLSGQFPASVLALKAADAFVKTGDDGRPVISGHDGKKSNYVWWPRNYTGLGIRSAVVTDCKSIDLSGAVFVLGANALGRAAIWALARIGFGRFSIADANDEIVSAFCDDLSKSFLGASFEFVPKHLITQLPSVHSAAVNTFVPGRDLGVLGELYYFNFLQPGGIWLDLSYGSEHNLEVEASAVGATIERGERIAAWSDYEWARETLGVNLSVDALTEAYSKKQ